MTFAPDLDRRSLLQLAGGAGLAAGFPALGGRAFGAEARGAPKSLVLVDRRYSESVLYAQGYEGAGVEIVPLGRDLARAWQDEFLPRLTSKPLVVTGVTLPADLFGLERLAEGSGAVTVAKFAMALDHAPHPGRPKHFVGWMLRWDDGGGTDIG